MAWPLVAWNAVFFEAFSMLRASDTKNGDESKRKTGPLWFYLRIFFWRNRFPSILLLLLLLRWSICASARSFNDRVIDGGWRGGKRFEKFEKLFDRKYLIVFDGIFFFRCRRFFELIRYLDRLFYFFGWCIFWKLSIKFVHNFFAQCEKCCKIWKRKTQYTVRAADGRSVIAESSCWNEKRIVARLVFEEENEEGLITVWCRISIPSSTITLPKKKETIASSFLSSPKLKQFLPLSSISSFIERETKRGRGNV